MRVCGKDSIPFIQICRLTHDIKLSIRSNIKCTEAELKEFKPRLKYGWFLLKLYSMFQDLSRRSIETGFWRGSNSLNSDSERNKNVRFIRHKGIEFLPQIPICLYLNLNNHMMLTFHIPKLHCLIHQNSQFEISTVYDIWF